ncbi:type II toxin-antitoxin system HicB family antitoxin [Pseudoduganella sp. FT26W]|uniref:Type II toxin-antitoxin system HicB family antitoxin n=1 Tax=Duganella aquatilis TaxID=2666082 RepID=A0A844DFC3_9BURK|nr:type II toxin-antitoxin system HicB family antitoxin [Duganella aquatilis]MRW86769.1 type II toxin-antitoxin system HicB family antitoxin [Duganella aquatilis]
MDIPVVIFKDEGSVYGVNVPDIKGVHSWGDTVEDALKNAKEAITSHIETLLELGDVVEITKSKIEDLQADPAHAGGIWALVDIDLEKLDSTPERINISLPRFVLSKIDRYVAPRHESRSGLLARAAMQLIEEESKHVQAA